VTTSYCCTTVGAPAAGAVVEADAGVARSMIICLSTGGPTYVEQPAACSPTAPNTKAVQSPAKIRRQPNESWPGHPQNRFRFLMTDSPVRGVASGAARPLP
jgi:hypothetical protein